MPKQHSAGSILFVKCPLETVILLKIKSADVKIEIIEVFAVTVGLLSPALHFVSATLQSGLRRILCQQSGCSEGRTRPFASGIYSKGKCED